MKLLTLLVVIVLVCVDAQLEPQPGNGGMWGGNMFGGPFNMMADMMMGGQMGVTPGPDMAVSTTRKPTRREWLLAAQSKKRRVDGPKVTFNPFRLNGQNSLQGKQGPPKDELEMFVDSVNRMATGFHRLEFRLTKAIKMIDKYLTTI